MDNKLNYIDSPSREQYIHKTCHVDDINVLNSNYSSLFIEMMEKSAQYPIPCPDGNSYSFAELMKYQPLVVLEEIKALPQKIQDHTLGEKITEWHERLYYHSDLKLSQVLLNLISEDVPAYECLTVLQSGYAEFRAEIETAGITDPSLALFDSFLHNYSYIASKYNDLWKRLGEFYVLNVLHRRPYRPTPDKAWLQLDKREDSHDILIPAGTEFLAGVNPDGSDFCYRSTEAVAVGHMKLQSVSSIMLRRQSILVDNNPVNYVRTILKKPINPEADGKVVSLFDPDAERGKEHQFVITGIMIESPMFILEEGFRIITVNFYPVAESLKSFQDYAGRITREAYKDKEDSSIYTRLLKTAFYLEISTEEGWSNIPVYDILYISEVGEECISISFRLDYNFPRPVPCEEKHGAQTDMPSLRVLINRDAPRFPYTWAREMYFNRVTILNEVYGVTSLELYNEQGRQDANSSFMPFGVLGERGSWTIVGNYEASLKPLVEAKLICKWLQQPEGNSLKLHYADYGRNIDNSSFRIRTEYLKDKKWTETSKQTSALFETELRTGAVLNQSTITWKLDGMMPIGIYDKDNFRYGVSTSGFLRMVLNEPYYGFGNSVYQHLFINSLIKRGSKSEVKLLQTPYIPTIDRLEFQYKAEETVSVSSGSKTGLTRLYHISPVATEGAVPVKSELFALADGPQEEGFLQFAFTGAQGYNTVRMYVDLLPSHHEFNKADITRVKWLYHDGAGWKQLDEEAVLTDETDNFLCSGIIEIKLPAQIPPAYLDAEGRFWMCAAFDKVQPNYPAVHGFFMNTVYVEAEIGKKPEDHQGTDSLPAGSIKSLKKDIPGIISVRQIRAGYGGLERETINNMLFRASNQAQYRRKPATPEDYERIVLERFPYVDKVKCFPACDTKNMGRKGVVTLAVMRQKKDELLPLCSHDMLFAIEEELSSYVSPFVTVDAINPVYEEVMMRCNIQLKPGIRQSIFMRDIKEEIDRYIAPWIRDGKMPVFGHTVSVIEVEKILENRPEVEKVHHASLIIQMVSTQKTRLEDVTVRKLLEFSGDKRFITITPSHPWYVMIPAKEHLVFTGLPEEYEARIGTGDLEIDNTFIIKA